MPPAAASKTTAPLFLVCGEDEFGVKQRAKSLFHDWIQSSPNLEQEILDGAASNAGDALKVLGRLRQALQTLPFFGSGKAIWLQNCNFLGDERTASAAAVTEDLADLSQTLKTFPWDQVRLLISAGKVDKRKTFYKTVEKLGKVELLSSWSVDDRDWVEKAGDFSRSRIREGGKSISEEALDTLVLQVGPQPRMLASEIEKLVLFAGESQQIETSDVQQIVTRNKQARAFALGDALGERHLQRGLRCLDEEIAEMKTDSQRSEIGLLYGLISKVRSLILLQELLRSGKIKPTANYQSLKGQLESIPDDQVPQDKKYNPKAINAYILFKALGQVRNYQPQELIRAMEILLECNLQLVSSSLDSSLILQGALVEIIGTAPRKASTHR